MTSFFFRRALLTCLFSYARHLRQRFETSSWSKVNTLTARSRGRTSSTLLKRSRSGELSRARAMDKRTLSVKLSFSPLSPTWRRFMALSPREKAAAVCPMTPSETLSAFSKVQISESQASVSGLTCWVPTQKRNKAARQRASGRESGNKFKN